MNYRNYDHKKDKKAVFRILKECGWVDDDKSGYLNIHLPKARTIVSDVNNEAECMVVSALADLHYLKKKLKFSAVTGVTVSLIARKQGLAGKLTAQRLALDVADGAEVAGLSFFEQGFYDKLGFGNCHYQNIISFSPSTLKLKQKCRIPQRLTSKDWKKMHRNRINRKKHHGALNFPDYVTKADVSDEKEYMGFGYFNDKGDLTHHFWLHGKGKEQ